MTQFTISIADNKASMFLEFMKNLAFVKRIEIIEDTVIPLEHKDIVRDRIKKSEGNPERLLDWDKVKDNFILD